MKQLSLCSILFPKGPFCCKQCTLYNRGILILPFFRNPYFAFPQVRLLGSLISEPFLCSLFYLSFPCCYFWSANSSSISYLQWGRCTKICFGDNFWLGVLSTKGRRAWTAFGIFQGYLTWSYLSHPNMRAKFGMWRAHLGKPNMVGLGIPELTMQNATQTPQSKVIAKFWCDIPIAISM